MLEGRRTPLTLAALSIKKIRYMEEKAAGARERERGRDQVGEKLLTCNIIGILGGGGGGQRTSWIASRCLLMKQPDISHPPPPSRCGHWVFLSPLFLFLHFLLLLRPPSSSSSTSSRGGEGGGGKGTSSSSSFPSPLPCAAQKQKADFNSQPSRHWSPPPVT